MIKLRLLFTILIGIISLNVLATHNRAGEITYRHIEGFTYEITLITYTRGGEIDRVEANIRFGDGDAETVNRNSKTLIDPQDDGIFKNVYITRHTYSGSGTYNISYCDPNRIGGIENIPGSINIPFCVESILKILPQAFGDNNSPVLLQPPIDFACLNRVYTHNPAAYDVDGDSLVFSFTTPLRASNTPVEGFLPPENDPDWSFTINSQTGQVVWDVPTKEGIYNIAILIEEYRYGEKIGEVIRDMQIFVIGNCRNRPPQIVSIKDTCIEAGQLLNLQISASDPDSDPIEFTATGGPFEVSNSPAKWLNTDAEPQSVIRGDSVVQAIFQWQSNCSHIRKSPYTVVFKAEDQPPFGQKLADLQALVITVVGPEPENPLATPEPRGIEVTWDLPKCQNVRGYRIYKRIDSSFWEPDYCETGVPSELGFSQIAQINNPDDRSYFDSDVNPGTFYCYRITGIYQNNNQYEPVEGYASVEVCAQLKQDIPLITNADVESTNISRGKVFTAFTKPYELDTVVYPEPYKYELYRGPGFSGETITFLREYGPYTTFEDLVKSTDTTYLDSLFNTETQANNYDIKLFFTNDEDEFEFVGNSRQNSTIFLEITPTHKSLILEWSANVLWKNEEYVVYREDRQNPDSFFVLDTITEATYKDTGLINGLTYCYYVQAKGKFQSNELPANLINKSQIACQFPVDTFPPCPPTLEAVAECANFTNLLNWDYDFPCDSDIVSYNIYFRRHKGAEFNFVTNIDSAYIFTYRDSSDLLFESQAGCYVVAAVDSYDNQSRYSNQVCLNNCPLFELPNVFTPNGDNINDLYIPLASSRNIDSLNFKVFNRWGEMVFETSDPQINWDGTDQESGNPLSPGTYFYEATFFESYLERIIPKKQAGAITLIR